MSSTFTQYSDKSIWSIEADDLDPTNALKYLNDPDHFRPFSQGLTELICRYGYDGTSDDIEAKTYFVLSKLSSISVSISKSTVRDWFADKRRPSFASVSRTHMFELCFALSVSFDDVKWFFSHVYFDRVFNCHTITEAVYYYCFTRQLPYSHAQALLSQINTFPSNDPSKTSANVLFTTEIRNRLDRCTCDEELLRFFKNNKNIFNQWNKTASERIQSLLRLIQGRPADRAVIENCRLTNVFSKKERQSCGLVIQEYLFLAENDRFGYITGKNIASIDFMLERMITTNSGINKDTKIPDIVKLNFPSKKTFSDILKKLGIYTSYNAIRKCLILLKFYHFWAAFLLEPELVQNKCDNLFDLYCFETNLLLVECGYEELFTGNPYDWLFLWASTTAKPLDTLRNAVSCLEDE